MMERPLAGIRVLDLTQYLAGPLGIQILADLGAEIIKVERRDGQPDFTRNTDPSFGKTSTYFMSINRGKKDIFLDLPKNEHREVFLKLAEKCDIVAENFRPGVTGKLGLSYDDIKKVRPDVIYSAVSGFGQTGPYKNRGCVDIIAQAMSGFMSITGPKDGEPIKGGAPIADVCAALYEAVGLLAAIIHRDKTGEGGFIDSAMLSSMISISDGATAEYLNSGEITKAAGNRDQKVALFQTLPTRDGAVMVDAATDSHFETFIRALGLPDLIKDERFQNGYTRLANIDELEQLVFPITKKMTMTELAELCRNRGIPAGEVNTQERICRSGYIEEQQMIYQVHDSKEGDFKVIGLPMKFDKFEVPKTNFVPQPGEHSAEVLTEVLGMTKEEIKELYQI